MRIKKKYPWEVIMIGNKPIAVTKGVAFTFETDVEVYKATKEQVTKLIHGHRGVSLKGL